MTSSDHQLKKGDGESPGDSKTLFAEPDSKPQVTLTAGEAPDTEIEAGSKEEAKSAGALLGPSLSQEAEDVKLEEPAPESGTAELAELPATPAGLPGLTLGVLTALLALSAPLVYFAQCAARQTAGWPSPTVLYVWFGALFVHCCWFVFCRQKLVAASGQLLPPSRPTNSTIGALTVVLPFAWLGLMQVYFAQGLFFVSEELPLVRILPWLVSISLVYWLWAVTNWPRQLKKLHGQYLKLHAAGNEAVNALPKASWLVDLFGISDSRWKFPRLMGAWWMLPLMAVPYVWYWKKCAIAAYRIKNPRAPEPVNPLLLLFPQMAKANSLPEQINTIKPKSRLVIRYRRYAAMERWVRQRFGNNEWRNISPLRKVVAYTAAPFIVIAAMAASLTLLVNVAPLLQRYSPMSLDVHTGSSLAVSVGQANYGVLAAIALLAAALIASIIWIVRKQATHYQFTQDGFSPFRWSGDSLIIGKFTPWVAVKHIGLGGGDNPRLIFALSDGSSVNLNLGSVESIEDRETILTAIERWAPKVSREMEAVQALQPPVDHSYTELWLQALAAPPERDRLKPLTKDVNLGAGRYKVRRALGVGGQGVAYEAMDLNFGETVVLKEFLLPIYVDVSIRKEVLERFEGEAKILKQLDHPQVVKLSDFFIEDHRAYLVLEHIEGTSLRDLVVREGALPEARVRELAMQMCDILNYLHIQAPPVVHRDFTPENLILRNDGLLKLIDFNVARQVESTATGSIVGKPAFLPPEQFRGQPVPQSDIYGMGATLQFLLTGEDPDPITVSHPREKVSELSASIDAIVAKATAIEVKDRYESGHDLRLHLELPTDAKQAVQPAGIEDSGLAARFDDAMASLLFSRSTSSNMAHNFLEKPQVGGGEFKEPDSTHTHLREAGQGTAQSAPNPTFALQNADQSAVPNPPSRDLAGSKNNLLEDFAHGRHGENVKAIANKILSPFVVAFGAVSILTIAMSLCWVLVPTSPTWFDDKPALHAHWKAFWDEGFGARYALGKDETELAKCIAIDPSFAKAYFMRAIGRLNRHDGDPLDDFDKLTKLDPNDKLAHYGRGELLFYLKRYGEAAPSLKATLVLPFKQPGLALMDSTFGLTPKWKVRKELVLSYLHTGQDEKAIAEYQDHLVSEHGSTDVQAIGGMIEELRHDPRAAITYLEKRGDEAGHRSSVLQYANLHIATLKKVQSTLRGDEKTEGALWAVCEGLAYNGLSEYPKANDLFSQAISLSPDFADAYVWRADGYRQMNKADLALIDLDKAISLDPSNIQAHYFHARMLQALGKYEAAVAEYTKVESLGVKDSGALYLMRGLCQTAEHNYKGALADYSKVASDPLVYDDAQVVTASMVGKAIAYCELGLFLEAREQLKKSMGRAYDFPYPRQQLSDQIERALTPQGHRKKGAEEDRATASGTLALTPVLDDDYRRWNETP